MSREWIVLCPGQGAQRVGMGKAWFDAAPQARQTFAAADEILGDRLGKRLSELCFEGPDDRLNRTDAAQIAIFVTSVACCQALLERAGEPPYVAATAGLSLGEYTALHLAGAIAFEDALELVALRGKAMQDAAEASDGGMVALMGADEEKARALCEKAAQGQALVPANFNAPGQVVLSGDAGACERAAETAGELGLRATPLTVAGAFHSPLMAPAAERLRAALEKTTIREPSCPVLSNVTGEPHAAESGSLEDSIRRRLVDQLTRPVRWDLDGAWLVEHASGDYHELAPGKVLAGLMRRIDRATKVQTHDEPSDA